MFSDSCPINIHDLIESRIKYNKNTRHTIEPPFSRSAKRNESVLQNQFFISLLLDKGILVKIPPSPTRGRIFLFYNTIPINFHNPAMI